MHDFYDIVKRRFIFALAFISLILAGYSLSKNVCAKTTQDSGIWISNTYQTDFGGSKYLAFLEIQPRTNNDSRDFQQLIVRPLLGYKVSKSWSAWLGYTWQGEYNSADKFDNATNDIVQQIQYSTQITDKSDFQYRGRLEERFFGDGADLALRTRHRFRTTYKLFNSNFYGIAFDEVFFYLNNLNDSSKSSTVQTGFNQNRAYIGIGYNFTKNINLDTGYQNQYINYYGKPDASNNIWLTNLNIKF